MPTVTRPKRPIDPKFTPVRIALKHRRNLVEAAGLFAGSPEAKGFLRRVEHKLTWHANMLKRVPLRSLPVHTRAALMLITKQAADLAQLLDPANLPIEVSVELGDDVIGGAVHRTLSWLAYTAGQAAERLSGQSGRGQLDREMKEAHRQAITDLDGIYRRHANPDACDAQDHREFLETCGRYLKLRSNG
jgi:hypothetical protein